MAERIADEARQWADQAARVAGDPSVTAATIAQVHATLALVEQQRIANRLALASIDLLEEISERSGHTLSFRIRPYLDTDDWASIEVIEEEASDGDRD